MAEMRAASGAMNFGSSLARAVVLFRSDVSFGNRRIKTRPTRAGIKLRRGAKERESATRANVRSLAFEIVVFTAVSPLGAAFAHNVELRRGEKASPFFV